MNIKIHFCGPKSYGLFAIVSPEDYDRVMDHPRAWYIGTRYAMARTISDHSPHIALHRFITSAKPGQTVDHINGDIFDNRRENLRIVDQITNNKNRRDKSLPKGVYYSPVNNKWLANARPDGARSTCKFIGAFETMEEAVEKRSLFMRGKYKPDFIGKYRAKKTRKPHGLTHRQSIAVE